MPGYRNVFHQKNIDGGHYAFDRDAVDAEKDVDRQCARRSALGQELNLMLDVAGGKRDVSRYPHPRNRQIGTAKGRMVGNIFSDQHFEIGGGDGHRSTHERHLVGTAQMNAFRGNARLSNPQKNIVAAHGARIAGQWGPSDRDSLQLPR